MNRTSLSALFALALFSAAAIADPPAPKSVLSCSPIELVDRLAKAKLVPVQPFTQSERAALEAACAARRGPKAKPLPQADATAVAAHLLAGGVSDPTDIAKYLKAFDALVAEAAAATRDAKTPREKADQLLRFLHKGVMAKGYVAEQSSLHTVFDSGTFNCVSSAELYYLVGTRLGLELKGISIPAEWLVSGHAAVDLIDGKARVQIEPTNAEGFEADVKAKQPGVISFGLKPDRTKGRDCDGYGLASGAASNMGVSATKADPPRRGEAVRWYAVALAFDPTNPTAVSNLTAEFTNWGLAAGKKGDYEQAVAVYAFALSVLTDGKPLRQNHAAVWSWYLDAEFEAGKYEQGLKVRARAAKAIPDDRDFQNPAEWATRAAEKAVDKVGWTAGLAVADAAIKVLPESARPPLRDWKTGARRRWSQNFLAKGDVDGSVKVLADGLAADPTNRELNDGLAYHTQTALGHLAETKGVPAVLEHVVALRKRFPENKGITMIAHSHAYRAVERLSDAGKFDESLKAAAAYKDFGANPDEFTEWAYRWWGRALAKDKKWDAALAKFAEGLKAVPRGEHLRSGLERTVDEWADTAIGKKDWSAAVTMYDAGLKVVPDSGHLKHNRSVCEERGKK